MNNKLLFWLFLVLIVLAGCEEQTACTKEAKICSDGTAVGRTGPNCEFTECPVSNFEECIAAGNPAMESYPRQCRHGDLTFVEELPIEEICEDNCGDGVCSEIVCLAVGCPCIETIESCSVDCK